MIYLLLFCIVGQTEIQDSGQAYKEYEAPMAGKDSCKSDITDHCSKLLHALIATVCGSPG